MVKHLWCMLYLSETHAVYYIYVKHLWCLLYLCCWLHLWYLLILEASSVDKCLCRDSQAANPNCDLEKSKFTKKGKIVIDIWSSSSKTWFTSKSQLIITCFPGCRLLLQGHLQVRLLLQKLGGKKQYQTTAKLLNLALPDMKFGQSRDILKISSYLKEGSLTYLEKPGSLLHEEEDHGDFHVVHTIPRHGKQRTVISTSRTRK